MSLALGNPTGRRLILAPSARERVEDQIRRSCHGTPPGREIDPYPLCEARLANPMTMMDCGVNLTRASG